MLFKETPTPTTSDAAINPENNFNDFFLETSLIVVDNHSNNLNVNYLNPSHMKNVLFI